MSEQDSYNGYVTEDDKCPNCGAVKVFSALVCPICGMSYAEAQGLKKDKVSRLEKFLKNNSVPAEEEEAAKDKGPFDPNASFKEFKKAINEENEEKPVIQEEVGKPEVEEVPETKPVSPDETPLNSGLYGDRRYRFSEGNETSFVMSEKRPDPAPDQTVVPTRYGLDAAAVREKREQSLSNEPGKNKAFSTTVNNHYEQYKTNTENSLEQTSYSSPYNRGSFDATPKNKSNTLLKMLPLAIVLIIMIVIGVFLYNLIGI